MRAHEAALTALHAEVFTPDRNRFGDISLFERCCAGGECAVGGNGADRDLIAKPCENAGCHRAHEIRSVSRNKRRQFDPTCDSGRNLRLAQARQGAVDRGEILVDDRLTFAIVGLVNCVLDIADGFFPREDPRYGEKASLQNRIGSRAQSHLARDRGGVDDEQPEFLVDKCLLHGAHSFARFRRRNRARSTAPWRLRRYAQQVLAL